MDPIKNKITNVNPTTPALELSPSEAQSKPITVWEEIVASAIALIFKLSTEEGSPIVIPMPEIIQATGRRGGQTSVCKDDASLRAHTHKVSASGRLNSDQEAIWSIGVSPVLAQSPVLTTVYLLHAVCAGAGMIAKGKPNMKFYSRTNETFVRCLDFIGLDSSAEKDYKGPRGGIVDVTMSAATRAKFQGRIDRLSAMSVNGEKDVVEAPKANQRSSSLSVEFADVETMDAFLASIGASVDKKTGQLVKGDGSAWLLGKALAQVPAKVAAAIKAA